MTQRILASGIGLWLAMSGAAGAQTLQLPTFNSFATSTSVLVPDRGQTTLGGIQRSNSGQGQFGGPLGRGGVGSGAAGQAGDVSVGVVIHDFEAADELLLKAAAAKRARQGNVAKALPGRAAESMASLRSVAEIRAEQQRDAARATAEGPDRPTDDYLARAKAAELAGKPGVARVYYQMAARRASGRERSQILAQAAALATASPKPTRAAR